MEARSPVEVFAEGAARLHGLDFVAFCWHQVRLSFVVGLGIVADPYLEMEPSGVV